MRMRSKSVTSMLVAGAFLFSSTAAGAASTQATPQVHPWAALTALSGGAPAAALCGAAAVAAAAQTPAPGCFLPVVDAAPVAVAPPTPVPVPPVEPVGEFALNPLFLALGGLAAAALIYVLLNGDGDEDEDTVTP